MNNNNLIRKMIRFLKENGLSDENIKEVKIDLKDMELEAQENNQSLEEFLGKDYREFCIELLEVGYDFKKKDLVLNEHSDTLKISKEILAIMIPSVVLSIITLFIRENNFMLFMAIQVVVTLGITYSIFSRDKDKYSGFKRELVFTNVVAFLTLFFFAFPLHNVNGDGIFGNYYNGIYESLIVQWVRVIDYIDTEPFFSLNENIIVINDYLFTFSLALLIGYAIYTYIFKKSNVKFFMIPLALIAIVLSIIEYFTAFQIPFMGALVFTFILVFYVLQFNELKFSNKKYILYGIGGFFFVVLLVSIIFDIEFISSEELYFGQDLLYVIKIILLGYLVAISIYALMGVKKISSIKNFYTFLNIFIIAYAMFMITSYLFQGVEQFNIEEPLKSWQSIRIVNQMAFAAYGYYVIDSLKRRYGNLDNQD